MRGFPVFPVPCKQQLVQHLIHIKAVICFPLQPPPLPTTAMTSWRLLAGCFLLLLLPPVSHGSMHMWSPFRYRVVSSNAQSISKVNILYVLWVFSISIDRINFLTITATNLAHLPSSHKAKLGFSIPVLLGDNVYRRKLIMKKANYITGHLAKMTLHRISVYNCFFF